jgi:hypothetical protein
LLSEKIAWIALQGRSTLDSHVDEPLQIRLGFDDLPLAFDSISRLEELLCTFLRESSQVLVGAVTESTAHAGGALFSDGEQAIGKLCSVHPCSPTDVSMPGAVAMAMTPPRRG